MKKLISTFTLFVTIAHMCSAQQAGDYPMPTSGSNSDKLSISLNSGRLLFNKTELSKTWEIEPVFSFFGTKGRTREGYNITHSYDDQGIAFFEKSKDKIPTGEITEFQVFLSTGEKNEVTPSGLYSGKLEIEHNIITMYISLVELRKKLKDHTESKSYMEHSYRFARNGIYMYVQYDVDDARIQKISFGKDTRGNN